MLRMIAHQLFSRMKRASKRRGHKFTLDFNVFFEWLLENDFKGMLIVALEADDNNLNPSVDRLDTNIGYLISNMELVTWRENQERNHEHLRKTRPSTTVYQYTKDGVLVAECSSIRMAAKAVGCSTKEIRVVLDNPKRSCKGYRWTTTKKTPQTQ